MRRGQTRLHIGQVHEQKVQRSLAARGWDVQPWGQGLLSDSIRQAFMDADRGRDVLLWRWLPDLIAAKGRRLYLVDPKTDIREDTPFFSIELRCIMAQRAMSTLGIRHVVVWSDFSCNFMDLLRIADIRQPAGESRRVASNGSGTPFALVRKSEQLALDDVFGHKLPRQDVA